MKLAIVSDIHGNFLALQEVMRDIEKNHVDQTICLGDVITLGLQPLEVLETIKKQDWSFILGNHESALLDMENALHYKIAAPVINVLEWCRSKLNSADLDFLKSFKNNCRVKLENNNELLCFHGSPKSNIDLITSTTAENEVEDYISKYQNSYFTGGHSHLQMLRQHNGKLILNPGSVGMPFLNIPETGQSPAILPWAEYAIFDINAERISVDLKRVPYNISTMKKIIRDSDIPLKNWWHAQFK